MYSFTTNSGKVSPCNTNIELVLLLVLKKIKDVAVDIVVDIGILISILL